MSAFVIRPAQPSDMAEVGALVARVFSQQRPERYATLAHRSGDGLLDKPGFTPNMCRVGVLDGKIIAHALTEPYTLRYGSAHLHVASIGEACAHPDYHGHGYASAVLRDAFTYMAEQGAHLALLEGVSQYYERFGFSPVWPHYLFEVSTADAAALMPRLPLREPRITDVPHMAALYEQHWGGRVTFIRSPDLWTWRVMQADRLIEVAEEADGQPGGYIVGHDVSGETVEVIAHTPDAAVTLLARAGRLYQEAGIDTIRWHIPPDDALVNFARTLMTVTVSARYHASGGWMARLIDAPGLVDMLLPELIAQARTVLPEVNRGSLQVVCQPESVHISLRGRKNTLCVLTYQDFIQVLFGSLRPAALAVRLHNRLPPDGVQLLDALFPPRIAALAGWDWF